MKPIEAYPDKKRCELCGATITDAGIDPYPDHPAAETVRRLAFLADQSPSLAIVLIHRIAGRTERQIAAKLKITHQAVHGRLVRARKAVLPV